MIRYGRELADVYGFYGMPSCYILASNLYNASELRYMGLEVALQLGDVNAKDLSTRIDSVFLPELGQIQSKFISTLSF